MVVKFSKWPYNKPNVAGKMHQQLPLLDPPIFTQIGILGLKIYHLATLQRNAPIFGGGTAPGKCIRQKFI
jgi:hypothetical protein